MTETTTRFTALDVFRGMTICFMIIVISPGSGALPYWPLDHAPWHGFTPTDLVFPSFLFAVGNALSFSEKKFVTLSSGQVLYRIFKRFFIIFLLGYLMSWFPFYRLDAHNNIIPFPIAETRYFGVLQRIAICYLLTALAVRYLSSRFLVYLGLGILLVYWVVLLMFGTGDPFSIEGNAITKLDILLFGSAHLYYDHGVFDPEGLLSTLPAVVNTLAGYLVGKYLQEKGMSRLAIRPLFLIGIAGIVLALLWNTVFPINKKIWSSSFSLLTIGLDLMLLPLLVLMTDKEGSSDKGWVHFFTIFGKNPLVIYMFAEMLLIVLRKIPVGSINLYEQINNSVFQAILPGSAGSLLFALTNMLFCWCIGWLLNKNKIYIKV
ncbi:Predicted acyltransferase [Pedobacter sp. ok626]|uniref:acyltransferase family protein n=1 Tax=Pedobacter sp. ok626 TaxID=1761882 RepID=UPI0008837338|nr:heparan-alpha-glucosaminide N-acetyltransferase domain-containing protein [Pedobacter sp. ok626]SDJ47360.1 Predicted acyltransferase [Pedobacter sp. ok626]